MGDVSQRWIIWMRHDCPKGRIIELDAGVGHGNHGLSSQILPKLSGQLELLNACAMWCFGFAVV
jgi:hypothetical protein